MARLSSVILRVTACAFTEGARGDVVARGVKACFQSLAQDHADWLSAQYRLAGAYKSDEEEKETVEMLRRKAVRNRTNGRFQAPTHNPHETRPRTMRRCSFSPLHRETFYISGRVI